MNRMTSTSSAVVISSKNKTPNEESNHHHALAGPSHGFLDDEEEEDEKEERKAAISSPIKGGKRLSSAVKYSTLDFSIVSNQLFSRLLSSLNTRHHHHPNVLWQAVRRNTQMRTFLLVVKKMVHGAASLSLPICNIWLAEALIMMHGLSKTKKACPSSRRSGTLSMETRYHTLSQSKDLFSPS
jgi:hypothetical protein